MTSVTGSCQALAYAAVFQPHTSVDMSLKGLSFRSQVHL